MSPLFDVRFGTKSMCHIDSMVGLILRQHLTKIASVCMVVGFSPAEKYHMKGGDVPDMLATLPPQVFRCKFRCVYPVSFTRNRHSQIEVVRLLEISGIDIAIS